jgi:GNAT superfamily N-acetyltransferase
MDNKIVSIKTAAETHAQRLMELCIQLGYKTNYNEIKERLLKIIADENSILFIAEQNSKVIGFIHVSIRSTIESGEMAEITGLVVDESFRGKGIGKSLVKGAEEWAKLKRQNTLRVRTNIIRTETHIFYRNIGFEEKKKQTVFQKKLNL